MQPAYLRHLRSANARSDSDGDGDSDSDGDGDSDSDGDGDRDGDRLGASSLGPAWRDRLLPNGAPGAPAAWTR